VSTTVRFAATIPASSTIDDISAIIAAAINPFDASAVFFVESGTAPAHKHGQVWFNTNTKIFNYDDGTTFWPLPQIVPSFVGTAFSQFIGARSVVGGPVQINGGAYTSSDTVGTWTASSAGLSIPISGRYQLNANLLVLDGPIDGAMRTRKNGADAGWICGGAPSPGSAYYNLSSLARYTAGDKVTVNFDNPTSDTVTVNATISLQWVGP
jgi:hypothetical protein